MLHRPVSILLYLFISGVTCAQTSELYLTEYGGTGGAVVQNGAIVRSFTTGVSTENGLAVVDTIRAIASFPGNTGREYDLQGTPLSATYPNGPYDSLYDGTTDGTTYNYSIDHNGSYDVIRFDRDWASGVRIFRPNRRCSGIAYDLTDDTIWTTVTVGSANYVQHYDLMGAQLGEFPVSVPGGYAIGLDPADGTLWIPESFGTAGNMWQFSKAGAVLQTINVPGLFRNAFGAEFQAGASLSIRTVTAGSALVAPGQTGVTVSYDAENTGMNGLTITSADLSFEDASMIDVSSEYSVTPDPANPTSIAPGVVVTFDFTVDVLAMASLGTIVVDGVVDVTDQVTGGTSTDSSADTPDTWDVVGAVPVARVVDATPARVSPGSSGHVVTVTVENVGYNGLDIALVDLSFTDPALVDVSADCVVNPDPANPTSIAIGASETFTFTVDVLPTATQDAITVDAIVDAVDQVSMATISDVGADVPDTWEVISGDPHVRVVDAVPATVSQGGSGYPVSVTVENLGLSSVLVVANTLTMTGTVDRSAEYTVSADPGNPTLLLPSTIETFDFTVAVDGAATIETITIDAAFAGLDTVTGEFLLDADADVTDTWDLVMCGATLCGDCNGDGMVTILDALLGAQHAAGLVVLTGVDFTNCNVIGVIEPNPGAQVDVLDALTVAQFAAGLPVTLACC